MMNEVNQTAKGFSLRHYGAMKVIENMAIFIVGVVMIGFYAAGTLLDIKYPPPGHNFDYLLDAAKVLLGLFVGMFVGQKGRFR